MRSGVGFAANNRLKGKRNNKEVSLEIAWNGGDSAQLAATVVLVT
jgi:hypothetical protein